MKKYNTVKLEQLAILQSRYDLLDEDWLRLKKENIVLKERIETYKEILGRWEKIKDLFGDKVQYGESWTERIYKLVKELQQENRDLRSDK